MSSSRRQERIMRILDDQGIHLDAILRASSEYARGISDNLKEQVYTALRHLAQGFLDYGPNQLQPDAATLKTIYDNSLIVLYRLLFIFYAEARDLLPLRESATYRAEYSLDAIKREVARRKDAGPALLPTTARLWAKLKDLFQIIDQGSPPLQVATFNGGLFDPVRHAFLDRYVVGDARLQEALDLLARVEGQFIDYRDLAERHLGTIYEGLLEYHLAPSTHEAGWTVAILNDKGERHRTGSYYTPEFVVQYIVDQTLGPVLRAAVEGKTTDAEQIAAVLAINVCDPATGSGHFPVAATEYIARFLVDLAVVPDDGGSEPDLLYWKRRVAQSCIYGVDLNPLAIELAKLSLWLTTVAKDKPLSFLDHHLRAGNALVGSRIKELKVGNEGAGAQRKKRQQQAAAGQLALFDEDALRQDMRSAVGSMHAIEGSASATVAEVKAQERAYAELRELLMRKYGRLANLVTATYFGVTVDTSFWNPLADYATGRILAVPKRLSDWLDSADTLAAERRFFHWELEFPEVFFDADGRSLGEQSGFDAVIGNPPYVRQEQLAPIKPYLQQLYSDTYAGTADLYVYFVHQGMRLLQHDGQLAYIASNSWLRANYATALRNYLRTQTTIEQIIDLGDNRVFADAPDVYPAILVAVRSTPTIDHSAQVALFTRGEGIKNFAEQIATKLSPVSIHDQTDSGWQLGNDVGRRIFNKLVASGSSLSEIVRGQLYYGIKTGLNEAFIIDQATRDRLIAEDSSSAEAIKPLVNGEDIRSWHVENEGRWLILLPNQWTKQTFRTILNEQEGWSHLEAKYPALAEHLKPFADAAQRRSDKGEFWWELRPCNYYADFEGHKIFWPELANRPRFALADPDIVGNKTTFMIPGKHPYVLGILMSRSLWFAVSHIAAPFGERKGIQRYLMSAQYISRLPIPDASDDERTAIGDLAMAITAEAKARYELHRRTRRRILADLGSAGGKLNNKLTAWWELDFAAFRAEIQKVFKRDIPLKDRDDWEEWFHTRRSAHQQRTDAIIRLETELNKRAYALFELSPDEIAIIEASTKYKYGEV